jgi:DNA-binding transcriptional LysR family regulator
VSIENQDAEIGMTIGPVNEEKLDSELIISTPQYTHVAIVHESHPFSQLEQIQIEDMKDVPVVVMNENTRTLQVYTELCQRAGFEPIIAVSAGDVLSLYYYAEINSYVSISTNACAHRVNKPNVRAIPFATPDFAWKVYLIHRKGVALSAEAKAFIKCVRKHKIIESW